MPNHLNFPGPVEVGAGADEVEVVVLDVDSVVIDMTGFEVVLVKSVVGLAVVPGVPGIH